MIRWPRKSLARTLDYHSSAELRVERRGYGSWTSDNQKLASSWSTVWRVSGQLWCRRIPNGEIRLYKEDFPWAAYGGILGVWCEWKIIDLYPDDMSALRGHEETLVRLQGDSKYYYPFLYSTTEFPVPRYCHFQWISHHTERENTTRVWAFLKSFALPINLIFCSDFVLWKRPELFRPREDFSSSH